MWSKFISRRKMDAWKWNQELSLLLWGPWPSWKMTPSSFVGASLGQISMGAGVTELFPGWLCFCPFSQPTLSLLFSSVPAAQHGFALASSKCSKLRFLSPNGPFYCWAWSPFSSFPLLTFLFFSFHGSPMWFLTQRCGSSVGVSLSSSSPFFFSRITIKVFLVLRVYF